MSRVALVTGSSSGIGRACADMLAANGWRVWGGSRSSVTPKGWQALSLDVTSEASVGQAVGEVLARGGRLDALVHAAGISVTGAVEEVTDAQARLQLETNYLGTVRMLRAVLPAMREKRHGSIVVIGSIGGLIGLPYLAHYSASKFALDGLIEALRHEVRQFGIEATIVHPGDFRTAIVEHEVRGASEGPNSPYHAPFTTTSAMYARNVATARPPEVVARAVMRLLERRRLPARVVLGTPMETAGVGLKRFLPQRLFEAIIRSTYKL